MEEQKIFPQDVHLQEETIEVYRGFDGYFYQDLEVAIQNSITHNYCKCGNEKRKIQDLCPQCREKETEERYNNLPVKIWDKESFIYDDISDQYFEDDCALEEYLKDHSDEDEDGILILPKTRLHPTCMETGLPEYDPSDLYDDNGNLIISEEHPIFEKIKELNGILGDIIINHYPDFKYRLVLE